MQRDTVVYACGTDQSKPPINDGKRLATNPNSQRMEPSSRYSAQDCKSDLTVGGAPSLDIKLESPCLALAGHLHSFSGMEGLQKPVYAGYGGRVSIELRPRDEGRRSEAVFSDRFRIDTAFFCILHEL